MQLFIALDTSSALIVVVVNYLIDIWGEIYILGNVFYFILSLFDEYLCEYFLGSGIQTVALNVDEVLALDKE